MECDMSLRHYRECIELALDRGYAFPTFTQYMDGGCSCEKIMLLRHDLDFDAHTGIKFFEIEEELGVKATYFVRLHAKYNPASLENYEALTRMTKAGFEVGLHFNAEFAIQTSQETHDILVRDKKILENILGQEVTGVSLHNWKSAEGRLTDKMLEEIGIRYNAYWDMFFKDFKYISESSCNWREGCMCDFINKGVKRLCVLTHPIWWYNLTSLENF